MSLPNSESAETQPISVLSRFDSFAQPRFLGVPTQEQIDEAGSQEGMLGGLPVEDVVAKDTSELEQAGITWDEAVTTLKNMAVTVHFLRENKLWGEMPGFPGLTAERTGAHFQFSDLVNTDQEHGDGDIFDYIAHESGEAKITYNAGGSDSFSFTINPQTLHLAEAHHILEKGNQYQLTGAQLATIVKLFRSDYFEEIRKWTVAQETPGAALSHTEKISYSDGTKAKLTVNRNKIIWLYPPTAVYFFRVSIQSSPAGQLEKVSIIKVATEGDKPTYFDLAGEESETSKLHDLVSVAKELSNRVRIQKSGLLDGLELPIHGLGDLDFSTLSDYELT
jgi:hypothetical protein